MTHCHGVPARAEVTRGGPQSHGRIHENHGGGQGAQAGAGEMQIGTVGSQKRTKRIYGEFEGTDEDLRAHVGDKGTNQLLEPTEELEEDRWELW